MRKKSVCLVVLHPDFAVRGIVAFAPVFIKYLFLYRVLSENETPFPEGSVACIFQEENEREKANYFATPVPAIR